MPKRMSVEELALVQGMRDTKLALARWNSAPLKVLKPWLGLSLAITGGLLLTVYGIAKLSTPDPTRYYLPGLHGDATGADYLHLLYRNSLVLALHAMACVAGFMAGSSLPLQAAQKTGFSRWVHEKAGPLAIGFVVCATLFSLSTQAYVLGGGVSTLSHQLGLSDGAFLVGLLPHAVPELTALFLPLAAWMIASRNDDWHELLAATFVTVGIAVPVLLASAAVELWVSPVLIAHLAGW
jgi:hypothetical protein